LALLFANEAAPKAAKPDLAKGEAIVLVSVPPAMQPMATP